MIDARSWEERDMKQKQSDKIEDGEINEEDLAKEHEDVEDLGYTKTKCRLCDRRMQNGIEDDALAALKGVKSQSGNVVVLVSPSLPISLSTLFTTKYDTNYHPAHQPQHSPSHAPHQNFLHPTLLNFVAHPTNASKLHILPAPHIQPSLLHRLQPR